MTRSLLATATATVALTIAAGLLLTACGGGGSDGSDPIESSATARPPATTTTLPASPGASPAGGVKRPSTALPKDLQMVFDWPKTGDATTDAVLNDGEQYMRAFNRAGASHDLHDPAYQFYSHDRAFMYAREQIQANIDGGWAPTGVDRYYAAKVASVRSGAATLSFCEDQSKAYSREVRTGKVLVTTPSDQDYGLYNLFLVKDPDAQGVWRASQITVIEGATLCKR